VPEPSPSLSIVVARVDPSDNIHHCLESILGQARTVGAEVIVAESVTPNLSRDRYPDVRHIHEPGASVYRLRALGLLAARGEILAFTEDHCRVAPGWCRAILDAHADDPEAAAIGGAVDNGAVGSLLEWAHFLIPSAGVLPPLSRGPASVMPGSANLTFKRRVIPATFPDHGVMEFLFTRGLAARGERMVVDDRLRTVHDQPVTPRTSAAAHFHSGRSLAGFRLASMGVAERFGRLLSTPVLPPVMLARTLSRVWRRRDLRMTALASVPWLVALLACHATGEALGYLRGPGDSPQRLH
jgi:hypothetical protein